MKVRVLDATLVDSVLQSIRLPELITGGTGVPLGGWRLGGGA